jgi:hypothetical protein
MPEVINVRPVGVQITVAYSAEELILLNKAYDHCEIAVDMKNEQEKKVHEYFVKVHAPFIAGVLDNLKKQGIIDNVA